jgi:hypothetical protein
MTLDTTEIPTPSTVAEAIASLHESSERMKDAAELQLELMQLREEPPELRTVILNQGNNGQYQVVDKATWPARSIGVLNLSAVPVFIGVGGISARPVSGAPFVPAGKVLILPVRDRNIEFGADPAVLLGNSAEIWVFRYQSLQPLQLSA